MRSIRSLWNLYKITQLHFLDLAKKNLGLSIFLLIAFICQIIFGIAQFGNIAVSFFYSAAVFIFISLAYTIVKILSVQDKQSPPLRNVKGQLIIIVVAILLNFVILSGQFPSTSSVYEISDPIRRFAFDSISSLRFPPEINSIIINNLTAVIIPLIFLSIFSTKNTDLSLTRNNLKILGLLLILYLPIIIFGEKPLNQVLAELPFYLFIAAIPEEVLYRGLFQSRLQTVLKNPIHAILLASIVFGLTHFPVNTKLYGYTTGLATCIGNNAFGGLFIGYLYYKTRSLPTVIIFHLFSGIALT